MPADTVMLSEIREQPNLLRGLCETRSEWSAPLVELVCEHRFRRVLFVGNGSPYYAGCTLRYATERLLGANAESIMAAEFLNHGSFDASGTLDHSEILLVCPAESGHSKGQVDAARRARALGIPVVCTTLNPAGVLARECDVVLAKPGTHERAMAATKSQTTALYLVLTCLIEAARALGSLDAETYTALAAALDAVPDNVEGTIEQTLSWCAANQARLREAPAFFLIGYGANYGTAQEAALKFYETHERPSYAFELEETLHGPFRALHRHDMALFLSAEPGAERERMALLAPACRAFCDNCVVVQSQGQRRDEDALAIWSGDIEHVDTIEYLVALQVIADRVSLWQGFDLTMPKVGVLDSLMQPAYTD